MRSLHAPRRNLVRPRSTHQCCADQVDADHGHWRLLEQGTVELARFPMILDYGPKAQEHCLSLGSATDPQLRTSEKPEAHHRSAHRPSSALGPVFCGSSESRKAPISLHGAPSKGSADGRTP